MDARNVELEKVIRANNDEFERNVSQQNAQGLVQAFYAENAVVMPPDQPPVNGKERIAEFWGQMFGAGLRKARLETVSLDASGDLACETGKYTLTMGAQGATATEATGKYVVVARKQADGSWKATTDIFNGNGS